MITEDFGVAFNVFWRHLEEKEYNKKDTYGNKDLVAGERALQGVERALKVLETLPKDYRDFYARRMVINIENKGFVNSNNSATNLNEPSTNDTINTIKDEDVKSNTDSSTGN